MSKISQQWLGVKNNLSDTCQRYLSNGWDISLTLVSCATNTSAPQGWASSSQGKSTASSRISLARRHRKVPRKGKADLRIFPLLWPHFCYQTCTGAPNVRPPKKKLITLDEVRDTQLGIFCPASCLTSYIFPFLSNNILLCKYQLNWRSFKFGFWTI